jgi:citrate lyase subunit beta/citryl-CoA lyase
VLFMPGSNVRAMNKARTLPADAVVFDLEDAVAPDAKPRAREQVAAAVNEGGYGSREVIVRVNPLDSPWGKDDLLAVAPLAVDGVLIPKVERPEQVHATLQTLDAANRERHSLWVMIETPAGVLASDEIASASNRIACLVMGTSDLAKEMRLPADPDRLGLVAPLSRCVLAARACGLDVLDGVQLDLDDDAAYHAACRQGRDLGFDGKTLIHPKQIAYANDTFAPSADEVERAREVIDAWDRARGKGHGVAVAHGRLVEKLHVDEAERTLALAAAIATREGNA